MGKLISSFGLSPQARAVFAHIERAGSISAREAMNDYGITSATLARRICDIDAAVRNSGHKIKRESKKHPITQRRYTRYSIVKIETAAA